MTAILDMLRRGISAAVGVFAAMPVELGLVLLSLVSAVIMLLVFRAVTPAHWMLKPRDRMTAAIYEMRLYLDHPRRVISAQIDLLRYSLTYSAAMLPAVVILTIPFGLMAFDLEARWAYKPLDISEPVTVSVQYRDGVQGTTLEAMSNDCAEVTGGPLDFGRSGFVQYTLKDAVDCEVTITLNGQDVTKRLDAGPDSVSPERLRGFDLPTRVTHEPALDDDVVERISVHHDSKDFHAFGLDWPWWVDWLILVFAFSGLLIKPLKITL